MSLGSEHPSYGNLKELDYCFFELFKQRNDISIKELENRFFRMFTMANLKGTIHFLEELDLIKISSEKIIQINKKRWPKKNARNLDILDLVIKKLIKNKEIDVFFYEGLLKYDNDNVVLKFSSIPLKYTALRDLLASLNFLKKKIDSPFHTLDIELLKRLPSYTKIPSKTKLSQAALDAILKAQKISGEKAELWVLEFEKNKFKKKKIKKSLLEKISKISDENSNAGYDLESFMDESSLEIDKYIEVKSFTNSERFFWSQNELTSSRRYKENYFLYIVDMNKINDDDYVPIEIQNPAKTILEGKEIEFDFIYESSDGKFTVKADGWKIDINKEGFDKN